MPAHPQTVVQRIDHVFAQRAATIIDQVPCLLEPPQRPDSIGCSSGDRNGLYT